MEDVPRQGDDNTAHLPEGQTLRAKSELDSESGETGLERIAFKFEKGGSIAEPDMGKRPDYIIHSRPFGKDALRGGRCAFNLD
jgi:hypothetical protein